MPAISWTKFEGDDMKQLPYRAQTASGDTINVAFPLHEDTESPMKVSQLLTAVLETIDREVTVTGPMANGDVLQALAMAVAIRSRMIYAPSEVTLSLANTVTACALEATRKAKIDRAQHGNA